ncbi:hypothetical protein L7F22_020041 [Adiantum nelumboides]|nr:hypothetical protein [Adiantum nelumboides]
MGVHGWCYGRAGHPLLNLAPVRGFQSGCGLLGEGQPGSSEFRLCRRPLPAPTLEAAPLSSMKSQKCSQAGAWPTNGLSCYWQVMMREFYRSCSCLDVRYGFDATEEVGVDEGHDIYMPRMDGIGRYDACQSLLWVSNLIADSRSESTLAPSMSELPTTSVMAFDLEDYSEVDAPPGLPEATHGPVVFFHRRRRGKLPPPGSH